MRIVEPVCSIATFLWIAQWSALTVSDEIAGGKQAVQSGTFSTYNASLAVDGDETTCCIACSTCNGYTPFNVSAWFMIDLGDYFTVVNVTIVNSKGSEDQKYMENFTISVTNGATNVSDSRTDFAAVCYYYNSNSFVATRLSVPCQTPLFGRYVTLRRVGGYRFDALSICEVYIYGYRGQLLVSSTTATSSSSSSSSVSAKRTPPPITTTTKTATATETVSASNDTGTVAAGDKEAAAAAAAPPLSTQALAAVVGVVVGVTVVGVGLVVLYFCIRTNRCRNEHKPFFLSRRVSRKPIITDSSSVYAAAACISHSPGRLIDKSVLANYVSELRSTPNGFQKEFKKLPDENAAEAKIGQLPDNRLKNRFTNVLPYDHTIVALAEAELDNDGGASSYINANFIAGYKKLPDVYIAAQGPRPNTVDDFWRMIWQNKVNVVVMLTQLIEKTKNKCELYWPEKVDETKSYRNTQVTLVSEDFYADFIDRQFEIHDVTQEKERTRTVRQLQYLSWLDNTRPQHCFQILSFRRTVLKLRQGSTGPILVHCSSGIGRTGAFVALDYLLDQVTSEGALSVFGCVEELRRQRMNMTQTQDQYEFLYDALVEEIEIGDTSKACDEFVEYCNHSSSNATFERQLEQLRKMSEPKSGRKSAGLDRENLAKNRNNAIVAYDDSRTYLDVSYVSRSDYVNAVSVSSYHCAHAYILTQVPLRDTVVDFWRLVWDYDLKTVVLLDDLTESYPKYWTESSGSRTYGPFLVEMILSEQESQSVWRRQFVLTNTKDKSKDSMCVHQFELKNWLKKAAFRTEDVDALFELRKQLADHLDLQPTTERIIIQCMDGSTKSGLFTAALHVIDRILTETRVDVCLSSRYVRIHRPTAVDSMDHFLFLHEVAGVCCRHLNPNYDGPNLHLKRLSLSTLYASVRSIALSTAR